MRIIEVTINGSCITRDCQNAGVQGEVNASVLRIGFDPGWDGLAKTLTWWDARGENEVKRLLTAELLEDVAASSRVYLAPIPGEALKKPGKCRFAVDGYTDGQRVRSVYSELVVKPAGRPGEPEAGDPTPTQAEQLQVQIDTVMDTLSSGLADAEAATAAAQTARSYAVGGTGTRAGEDKANARYYMEQARLAAGVVPALTKGQRDAMYALMKKYYDNRSSFIYDVNTSRNSYAPDGKLFDDSGRIRMNCSILPQLIWAGVDPASFLGRQGAYTGKLVKAFDWGYQFSFPNRVAYGLTREDGSLYRFVRPHEDSYEDSYSDNTYYSPDSTREDKQRFKGYMYGSDMAQEAYVKGFEIPLGCADVGDIIFYRAASLHSGGDYDGTYTKNFRNIGHLGIVYTTTYKKDGFLTILESTSLHASPIVWVNQISSAPSYVTRAVDLSDRACMCIRHPAAFGFAANVGDAFPKV